MNSSISRTVGRNIEDKGSTKNSKLYFKIISLLKKKKLWEILMIRNVEKLYFKIISLHLELLEFSIT